jgi:hypothetical protein
LGASVLLGAATGVRSTSGFWALVESGVAPAGSPLSRPRTRVGIRAALLGEAAADKTRALPPRTDPLPLLGRACFGAAAAAVAASWLGASRSEAAVVGAGMAVATARAATAFRSLAVSHNVPDAVTAIGEDAVVVGLAGVARRLLT